MGVKKCRLCCHLIPIHRDKTGKLHWFCKMTGSNEVSPDSTACEYDERSYVSHGMTKRDSIIVTVECTQPQCNTVREMKYASASRNKESACPRCRKILISEQNKKIGERKRRVSEVVTTNICQIVRGKSGERCKQFLLCQRKDETLYLRCMNEAIKRDWPGWRIA